MTLPITSRESMDIKRRFVFLKIETVLSIFL